MSRHRRRRKHGKAFGFNGLRPASKDSSSSKSESSASAPSASSASSSS